MTILLKLINAIMCLFLAFATYVQLNDPDWYSWILVYGISSYLCFMAVILPHQLSIQVNRVLTYLALAAAAFGFFYYLPSVQLDWAFITKDEYGGAAEEARESLGLAIAFIGVSITLLTNMYIRNYCNTTKH